MAIVASSTFPAVVIAVRAGAAGELSLDGPCDPPPPAALAGGPRADRRLGGPHGWSQAPEPSGVRCGGTSRSGRRNRFSGSGHRVTLPHGIGTHWRNGRGPLSAVSAGVIRTT